MSIKEARLDFGLDPDVKSRIERAAKLSHQSVSTFVVHAAAVAADDVLARAEATTRPAEQYDALLAARHRRPRTRPGAARPARPEVPPQVIEWTTAPLSSGLASGLSAVPGYLLAKLALDQTLHGQGFGGDLLHDALTRLVQAAGVASGRLIVVDAIDDTAAKFYRRYDFQPVKDNPRRLVIKVATVRAALG